jgi:hypothetical protein
VDRRADLDGQEGRPAEASYHPQDWAGIRTAEGYADPANGQVVILRENIQVREGERAAQAVARVILHEQVGHQGMAAVLVPGSKLKAQWDRLSALIPPAELQALRESYPHLAERPGDLALEWLAHQTGDRLSVQGMQPQSDWVAQTFHTLSGGRVLGKAALEAHVRDLIRAAQHAVGEGLITSQRSSTTTPPLGPGITFSHPEDGEESSPTKREPLSEKGGTEPAYDYNERHEDSKHREKRQLQPDDWENPVAGYDARGTAEGATRSLRSVRGGFYTQGVAKEVYKTWSLAAGAEISAVEAGRKPLFHDDLFSTEGDLVEVATRPLNHRLRLQTQCGKAGSEVAQESRITAQGTASDDSGQVKSRDEFPGLGVQSKRFSDIHLL